MRMEVFMKTLFEVLEIILPTIITGICTFFITKYTYNKNRPLDKLEISYNRVYYPLFKIINNEKMNNNIEVIISKSKLYFNKYGKYVDGSTLRAFNVLCQSNTETKRKDAFKNFKDNICNKNSFLRRRLGYLEPGFLQIYTYSSKSDKSTFRILTEFCALYASLVISSVANDNIKSICISVSSVILAILIVECIYKLITYLYYKSKK